MNNYKRLLIILGFSFALFLSVVIYIVFQLLSGDDQQSKLPLEISQVLPEEDTTIGYIPVQQIEFTFNQPISEKDFKYRVEPSAPSKVRLKSGTQNTIILSTTDIWNLDITVITVLTDTKSITGTKLSKPFSYSIKTEFPQNPDDSHY